MENPSQSPKIVLTSITMIPRAWTPRMDLSISLPKEGTIYTWGRCRGNRQLKQGKQTRPRSTGSSSLCTTLANLIKAPPRTPKHLPLKKNDSTTAKKEAEAAKSAVDDIRSFPIEQGCCPYSISIWERIDIDIEPPTYIDILFECLNIEPSLRTKSKHVIKWDPCTGVWKLPLIS